MRFFLNDCIKKRRKKHFLLTFITLKMIPACQFPQFHPDLVQQQQWDGTAEVKEGLLGDVFTWLALRDELELIQHLNVSCHLQITLDSNSNRYMMLLTSDDRNKCFRFSKEGFCFSQRCLSFKEPINIFFVIFVMILKEVMRKLIRSVLIWADCDIVPSFQE